MEIVDTETLNFTHRVVHNDKAFIPTRCECRAGCMRQMMPNAMDLLFWKPRQIAAHLGEKRFF